MTLTALAVTLYLTLCKLSSVYKVLLRKLIYILTLMINNTMPFLLLACLFTENSFIFTQHLIFTNISIGVGNVRCMYPFITETYRLFWTIEKYNNYSFLFAVCIGINLHIRIWWRSFERFSFVFKFNVF